MIKIKISELLGKRKMSRKDLAEKIGVRQNLISELYNETVKYISIDNMNRLCKALNCKIEDIFEYIPDLEENEKLIEPEKK